MQLRATSCGVINKKKYIFTVTGESNPGLHKRNIYEQNGVAVCSQKRALCIATVVFATLFAISLIIAFAGPQNCRYSFVLVDMRMLRIHVRNNINVANFIIDCSKISILELCEFQKLPCIFYRP
jgi:hypothetical protein